MTHTCTDINVYVYVCMPPSSTVAILTSPWAKYETENRCKYMCMYVCCFECGKPQWLSQTHTYTVTYSHSYSKCVHIILLTAAAVVRNFSFPGLVLCIHSLLLLQGTFICVYVLRAMGHDNFVISCEGKYAKIDVQG